MIFNLIRKDCLLIKKYLLLMILVAFGIPLFFLYTVPELLGFTSFMTTVIFVLLMLTQSVSLAETKYPKASSLLCSAPILRSSTVKAKYLFTFLLFIFTYIIYSILGLIFSQIDLLAPLNLIISLLIITIMFSIYLPIQYKFGYEKTKYFFTIVIMATPFLLPSIVTTISSTNLTELISLPTFIQYLIPIVSTIIIATISLNISINIFSKSEL